MDNIIYKTAKGHIGKNLTDGYNELGCAAALNNLIRLAIGQAVNDSPSTIQMYKSLISDKRFYRVIQPQTGDIIISPTNGLYVGHCGVISDRISDTDFKIISNNSRTFLLDEHLSVSEWWLKYKNLPTCLFRLAENGKIESDLEQKKISILLKLIELYKQLIEKLSINKLGSMTNSKLFRVNYKDILKGLIVACLSAVFLKLATALNVPGFSFTTYDWAGLLQVAIASGVGYISKQFFSSEQGNILGFKDTK